MAIEKPKFTVSGKPMEDDIGASRLNLLVRVVSREQAEAMWNSRKSLDEIGQELDIAGRDFAAIVKYYELPQRVRPRHNGHSKPVDLDLLAIRLWDILEQRIDDRINIAVQEALK